MMLIRRWEYPVADSVKVLWKSLFSGWDVDEVANFILTKNSDALEEHIKLKKVRRDNPNLASVKVIPTPEYAIIVGLACLGVQRLRQLEDRNMEIEDISIPEFKL